MGALRRRMVEDLRIRNYSPRTIETYVRCVAGFVRHFMKSPEQLDREQIRAYQVYLIEQKRASWALFNQTVSALKFLYRVTLGRGEVVEQVSYPRQERRLPVVLNHEELGRLFSSVRSLKHRALLMILYGAGLRLSEALHLRVSDIDGSRGLIRVEQGKGKRDRYVELSPKLREVLRAYWLAYRPQGWLFPGHPPERPLHPTAVQRALGLARLRARIAKPVNAHTLRHCFATHQLEAGTNLRRIQLQLGHSSLNTTAVYLHVVSQAACSVERSADLLELAQGSDRER